MNAKIHIGTSGWNYKHWKGNFYPEGITQSKWFEYYQTQFNTVELNNSFYKLPAEGQFESWRKQSKPDFIFSVKGSRYITHNKKLKEPEEPLGRIVEPARNLKNKLGIILFQLPPSWKVNEERLKEFLVRLPAGVRYTIEFRHPSWWNENVIRLLEEYGIAFCIFEIAGLRTPDLVTTDIAYIRLHGPGGKYQGSYGDDVLKKWASRISEWSNNINQIYIYFDNDQNGYAAFNALRLKKLLE